MLPNLGLVSHKIWMTGVYGDYPVSTDDASSLQQTPLVAARCPGMPCLLC